MESNLLHLFVSMPLFRPQAYLDPGSGSFLIQLLIGGLVAVGFGVRMFWGRIKALFSRKNTPVDMPSDISEDTLHNNDTNN